MEKSCGSQPGCDEYCTHGPHRRQRFSLLRRPLLTVELELNTRMTPNSAPLSFEPARSRGHGEQGGPACGARALLLQDML
jgi:hypothetical protein